MFEVLLVEDHTDSFILINKILQDVARVTWADTLEEGEKMLKERSFDLILLDVMLPDGEGYMLCKAIQADDRLKNIPVIFVTGQDSTSDKVKGFAAGADDFIQKPYDRIELRARVEARLKKSLRTKTEVAAQTSNTIEVGNLIINKDLQSVQRKDKFDDIDVELPPTEFKLLVMLTKEPGKVFSREEIFQMIWKSVGDIRSVDTHISKLRKKLGPESKAIESVWGEGYRFKVTALNMITGAA